VQTDMSSLRDRERDVDGKIGNRTCGSSLEPMCLVLFSLRRDRIGRTLFL